MVCLAERTARSRRIAVFLLSEQRLRVCERIRRIGVRTLLLGAAAAGLYSCSGIRAPRSVVESPIVRIGLVQYRDSVAFEPRGDFYILTREPRPRKLYPGNKVWTATVVESYADSLEIYRLLLAESRDSDRIDRRLDEFRRRGVPVERLERGEVLYAGRRSIADTRLQQLFYPPLYATEAAALEARQRLNLDARVVRDLTSRARGRVRLTSPDGEAFEAEQAVRLSGPFFAVSDLSVGEGFHWQRRQARTFRGEIEILIDGRGKLTVVNVLPLEDYMRGVVPQEMSSAFPFAALKAQAIVARTFAVHNFSRRHTEAEFDYCADVHCQAYAGVDKEAPQSDRAVRETKGVVLTRDGRTCFTPYSAVCGGHTEDVSAIWNGEAESHLSGIFDVPADRVPQSLDLSRESVVSDWIRTPVRVYCNVEVDGGLPAADYAKAYFRWQERLERTELEERIRQRSGVDLGVLQEIRPLKRSVSGRIVEIEFVGTRNRLRVENELRIRQLMSSKTLYSSCFIVEPTSGVPAPQAFVLYGAGWGHGVGLCQIGAAMMAKNGLSERHILQHYYPGTKIEVLY